MDIDGRDHSVCRNENLDVSIQRPSVSPVPLAVNRTGTPLNSEHSEFLSDNSKLFYQKLREFHESYGLTLVASVAGAVLDLFRLYKEVTFRGGFAMVTKHGRWTEVASAVNFTTKVSNPCFQLQELYSSLLYRFELIYYFGTLGKPDTSSASTLPSGLIENTSKDHPSSSTDCPTAKKKLQKIPCESSTGKLNGVIYDTQDSAREHFATVPSLMDGVDLKDAGSDPGSMQIRGGSAKSERAVGLSLKKVTKLKPTVGSSTKGTKKKDPEAPMRTRTAYHYFLCKECERLKKVHGQSLGPDLRKRVIDSWKNLSESDRLPYMVESRKDKERFDRQMVAYKERQNMQIGKVECQTPQPSGVKMVAYEEQQNMQSDKAQSKIPSPEPSVVVYNEHQYMQIGRATCTIPNPDPSRAEAVVYEEHHNVHIGKAQSKIPNPESCVYKEGEGMQISKANCTISIPEPSSVEIVAYEEHQDMLIGKPQFEIHNPEPSRVELYNPVPSAIEMVAYKEHQYLQIGGEQSKVHNPDPSEVEMVAFGDFQTTHVGRAEFTTPNPKLSVCESHDESRDSLQTEESDNACFDDDYHVSLQMEELDKLRKPDQSMVEFAVELMENADKLDASLQIQLGDFLSVP